VKLSEFIKDPSSNQFSMSRLCMGVLILIYIPIYFYLRYRGVNVDYRVIIACVASVASVYGLNSLAGPMGRVINRIRTTTTVDNDNRGEA